MVCENCGVDGPTEYIEFEQNIGLFFSRQSAKLKKHLCRPCIGRYFRSYTLTTLFLGWWGTASFLYTPIILYKNIAAYWGVRNLPNPAISAINIPIGTAPPSVASGSFKFKVVYGVILFLGALGLFGYYHVEFMERYAPGINAKLHNGAISNGTDGKYAGEKIGDDMAALESDIKDQAWTGTRSEVLSLEPYRLDLNVQNDKLQQSMAAERNSNFGKSDICEQLALDEFGPGLNAYTTATNNFFAFVKENAKLTATGKAEAIALSQKDEDALQQMRQYVTDEKRQGCDK